MSKRSKQNAKPRQSWIIESSSRAHDVFGNTLSFGKLSQTSFMTKALGRSIGGRMKSWQTGWSQHITTIYDKSWVSESLDSHHEQLPLLLASCESVCVCVYCMHLVIGAGNVRPLVANVDSFAGFAADSLHLMPYTWSIWWCGQCSSHIQEIRPLLPVREGTCWCCPGPTAPKVSQSQQPRRWRRRTLVALVLIVNWSNYWYWMGAMQQCNVDCWRSHTLLKLFTQIACGSSWLKKACFSKPQEAFPLIARDPIQIQSEAAGKEEMNQPRGHWYRVWLHP